MSILGAVVCLAFAALGVVILALRWKGDIKAGATLGRNSFFLEAKDRKAKPTQLADDERQLSEKGSSHRKA